MTDVIPGRREGLAIVLVLMVLLAITGLATIGLNLALAEARLAAAVRHRVGSDLLAEGAVALAMRAPLYADSSISGDRIESLDSVATWSSGEFGASVQWLSTELALVRAWGRTRGAPTARRVGVLGWALDSALSLGSEMPGVAVGGILVAPPGFAPAVDSCASTSGAVRGPDFLPDRWTSPLDLALGWRGLRPPTLQEVDGLRLLDAAGALVLIEEGEIADSDSVAPALTVALGSLTMMPGAELSGLLLVAGDLQLAPTARITGVVRVLGDMRVETGADVVVSRCRAEYALAATGWANGLHPVHGFRGLAPL